MKNLNYISLYIRIRRSCLPMAGLFMLVFGGAHSAAQDVRNPVIWEDTETASVTSSPPPITLPADVFLGCAEKVKSNIVSSGQVAREIERGKTRQRTFELAASTVEEHLEDTEKGVACWARLDGVWRSDEQITIDQSVTPDGWGSDEPSLIHLAHGNYTRPIQLILSIEEGEDSLIAIDAYDPSVRARFRAVDKTAMSDVLQRGGDRKAYLAEGENEIGETLLVDVTRSGLVRIQIDGEQFFRPQPGVRKSQEVPASDAWLISYNLKNMQASRKGYDVVTQDGFFFLRNPKAEIFARVNPVDYAIDEQYTVPLGLTFVPEHVQGMVFSKELIETASQAQHVLEVAFGAKAGSSDAAKGPITGHVASEYAKSTVLSRKNNRSTAYSEGHARTKLYALVNDQPYSVLSDAFIDAVEDARRFGREDPSRYAEIIEKFGTHYPYAVTYGAAAKITQELDSKGYESILATTHKVGVSVGVYKYGYGGEAHGSVMAGKTTGSSGTVGSEGATFVAVGGNGSWDQNGFTAGNTPYPILLDLRPIEELLNPMNFPGEPEVYETVRGELSKVIANYFQTDVEPLEDEPFAPLGMKTTGEYWIEGTSKANLIVQVNDMGIKAGAMLNGNCPTHYDIYIRTHRSSNEFRNNRGQTYIFRDTGRGYVHKMTWVNRNGQKTGLVHRAPTRKCN